MGIGKLDRSCTSKEPCRNANGHEPQGQRIGDRGCTDQPLTQYKSNKEGTSRACPIFIFVISEAGANRPCRSVLVFHFGVPARPAF
jgi:hypothetical protein